MGWHPRIVRSRHLIANLFLLQAGNEHYRRGVILDE